MKRGPLVWAALIVPTWLWLIACSLNAPVVYDTWTPYLWHREMTVTASVMWKAVKDNYLWNNPRLGHWATLPVSLPPWNAIVLPLVELALFYLGTSLAAGRPASLRRADDALVALLFAALVVACGPAIGPMLFYAPYTGNYLLGFMLALAFLAPYRFALTALPAARWWRLPALLLLGAAAGMCNEHSAPAVFALALAATVVVTVAARRPPAWMIAGLVGFAAGAAALYLAPGQHIRYGGLAAKHTALELVASHGISGALRLVRSCAVHLGWLVPFGAIALADRLRRGPAPGDWRIPAALAAGALVMVATLLGSPKLGDRLLFAPVVLACVAATDVIARYLRSTTVRTLAGALAAALVLHVAWRCAVAYRTLGPESEARLATLEHAAHGSTVTLPAFTVERSRYAKGEDLADEQRRRNLAERFGVAEIRLAGSAATSGDQP